MVLIMMMMVITEG